MINDFKMLIGQSIKSFEFDDENDIIGDYSLHFTLNNGKKFKMVPENEWEQETSSNLIEIDTNYKELLNEIITDICITYVNNENSPRSITSNIEIKTNNKIFNFKWLSDHYYPSEVFIVEDLDFDVMTEGVFHNTEGYARNLYYYDEKRIGEYWLNGVKIPALDFNKALQIFNSDLSFQVFKQESRALFKKALKQENIYT